MKIIIVGTAYPFKGGLATFIERLAQQLQSDPQNEVEIVTFTLQYPQFLFPGKTQLSADPTPQDLKIQRKLNSVNPLNWLTTGQYLKKAKADLIIIKFWLPFMGPSFGTILRMAKQNKRSKVVAILDNVIPHESRIGDKPFTQYFLKSVDGCVAMSQEVLNDLKKLSPNMPAVLSPHPVYDSYGAITDTIEARKKLNIPPEEKVLLFFGYIRKYKGLDLLLQAMTQPAVKAQNIKLLIAGEYYGDEQYYTQLIEDLQLKDQLYLHTDYIPNQEVATFFSAADCVVQPYRSATQSGISQIAYHFEKPMLVTNVGGLPEIVPDGKAGYVVAPTAESIAEGIVRFFANHPNQEFIQFIKTEKTKYSWQTFTHAITTLHTQL